MVKSIPWGLLAISAAFTLAFLWAWDKTYRATLSKALIALANVGFGGIAGHGAVYPLRFLKRWDEDIKTYTARGLQGSERQMVYALNRAAEPFIVIVGAALAIGLALVELAKYVAHLAVHTVTRIEVHKRVEGVANTVRGTVAVTKAQFRTLTHRVARLESRVAHIARAGAGTIARPFPRIRDLERDAKNAKDWIRKNKWLGAYASLLAFGLALLRKLDLTYTRCVRNRRLGKGICKTDPQWVEDFLTGTLLILGTASLVEFIKEAQAVEEAALESVGAFIREFDWVAPPKPDETHAWQPKS